MSYSVGTLTAYVNRNADALVTSSIFNAKTQQMIYAKGNVITGVKTAQDLNLMETDAVFQAGGTCGWNASGTTTITGRTLTVGQIKVQEALCPKTLNASHMQFALKAGSRQEDLPFEQEYSERKAAQIAKALETALWQGDTASGTANLARFDGLLKLIDAGSPVDGNTGGVTALTGITAANAVAIHDAIYAAIPVELLDKDDLVIFEGWDTFRKLTQALKTANMYHYDGVKGTDGEIVLPGTNIKVVAVNGLNSTNRIIAIRLSNIYLGTDMQNEEEKFDIFHAKEADEIRFDVQWKMGVQVAFTTEIVEFTLVP